MDNIAIQTSQNIAIEQTLASVGERIVAAIIDYSFLAVYIFIVSLYSTLSKSSLIFFLILIPVLFYHLVSELAMDGQSWGKKIMKIKVVKIDGTEAGFSSYLIRWVFRLVDVLLFFGAISTVVIILNGKGQRLGDIAANTTVIRLMDQRFSDTIFTRLPENYSLVYSQVSRLSDGDIYTAKEVLDFIINSYYSTDSLNMAAKAKAALETKMAIRSDNAPDKFLQTVINDYNYIHSR